uniref:transposase n=1 Tax=uncultured Corynebacterium sp. TaxID=159447 RepID=UPI0025914523
RILLTRKSLVTPTNAAKLDEVLTSEAHLPVQMTWHFYQEILAAYQADRPRDGKLRMFKVIKALHVKIPNELRELRVLGQTLWKRRADILAYFDTGASNGRWRTSTASWITCAVSPWGSGTRPTTC